MPFPIFSHVQTLPEALSHRWNLRIGSIGRSMFERDPQIPEKDKEESSGYKWEQAIRQVRTRSWQQKINLPDSD